MLKQNSTKLNNSFNLRPGSTNATYLLLLCDLANVRSEQMRGALIDHLVDGLARKNACEMNNVSQSNLSIKLKDLFQIEKCLLKIYELF